MWSNSITCAVPDFPQNSMPCSFTELAVPPSFTTPYIPCGHLLALCLRESLHMLFAHILRILQQMRLLEIAARRRSLRSHTPVAAASSSPRPVRWTTKSLSPDTTCGDTPAGPTPPTASVPSLPTADQFPSWTPAPHLGVFRHRVDPHAHAHVVKKYVAGLHDGAMQIHHAVAAFSVHPALEHAAIKIRISRDKTP